ncbi:acyl-CoA synthetase (AMP-forming)/AMP-acid ligase II [Natronocella acetinitrilica]|uniref:Acyl-CoA synthetase (AMP-forming)/AMP-acid ligase II n=1 Tax=Natronocella acetinitrilica TaxID=414046 RepID=A0AAE3KDK8_9GAMM|nr:AMP-binding protein [Natronocella acetinitrilica]MCP1676956.1 acyl-CoA synthetase (AMP-forming)/AMP-acid ligase II [Natronocella acetinitrilica]
MTVQTLITTWANRGSDQTYLVAPELDEVVTYSHLRNYVAQVSAHLDAMGVAKGEHVATLMDNGKWTAVLFLAVMASGRVVVPLNAISGDSQLAYVLDHSDARVVFASDNHLARARKISAAADREISIVPTSPDSGPEWPVQPDLASSKVPQVGSDDPALLIYTSGTTGKPKGVLLSHSNVIAGGQNTVDAHALTEKDRGLCVLPIYHINAEIVTLIAPLVSGGSVVVPHRFSTGAFWGLLGDHACTWFSVVPTIVSYLLEHAHTTAASVRDNPALSGLRFGRSASSALPPSVHQGFEQAFGIRLVETMGLSETAAQILSNPLPPAPCKYGSPGIAYGNEVKVVAGDGEDAAPGEIGEVVVRGDNVLKGYYKNPKATADSIRPDGWFLTGDLGYQDEDGFFFITGRSKELIIKGGENIAPREIDEVLLQHPAVLEAAAYAATDNHYGQEVMACVVLKTGKLASAEDLRAFTIQELGKFKAPREVHIVKWLPKGPSGKVQRLKIADMLDQLALDTETETTDKNI